MHRGDPATEEASALEAAKSRRRARTERQRAAGYEGVWNLPDYQGTDWVTGDTGQAAHRFEFIEAECRARGLSVTETEQDGFGNQVWLEIRNPAR